MAKQYVSNSSPDTLIGAIDISGYLGICVRTLTRWRKNHAFPVGALPDGRLVTTKPLIEQWILARIECTRMNGGKPYLPASLQTNNQELTPDSSKTSPNEAKTEQ